MLIIKKIAATIKFTKTNPQTDLALSNGNGISR